MRKYMSLFVVLCFVQSFAIAENLGIVNYVGQSIEISPYEHGEFEKCFIADAHTREYWDGMKYILPKSGIAYFQINEACKQNDEILFSAGDNFFGYDFRQKDLKQKIAIKFIAQNRFVYFGQDMYHADGVIIGVGL